MIKKLADGYILQEAATNCSERLVTQDGNFYSSKSSEPKPFEGSSNKGEWFDANKDPQLMALIEYVCGNDIKDKRKSGQDERDAALLNKIEVIPQKKTSGFLTRDVKARVMPGQDGPSDVNLPNGKPVMVSGKSKDNKWYEIKNPLSAGTLYVPIDSIAIFSE